MNLINVDELLSKLEKMKQSFMEKQQTLSAHIVEYTIRTVKSMPTIEAVPVVHGEWIRVSYYRVKCSICETQQSELEIDNFCPHCGADMRTKQN